MWGCPSHVRFGVSRALFEEFLRPLLLVGLFAPAEELSAAAVLGTFYFYSTYGSPCFCFQMSFACHLKQNLGT